MAQQITSPRGTQDVLPEDSYRWRALEKKLGEICERFGYREVRVPTFEHTELFARGVGDTTDVVGKEMYTMVDKGGRSITLRPEGTSGVARSFLQNGVLNGTLPVRGFYILSCFRYEKPQAGRLREFHQLGIENFGCKEPDADVEAIRVAHTVLAELGIRNIRLEINSIGCPTCRKRYHEALTSYFEARRDELCDTCKDRLTRNPMRILDCKSPVCQEISKDAPVMLDYLCEECADHFAQVKAILADADIEYTVNPRIVRGLDYYTKTVFEFIHDAAGAQGTVCGGGRYDGLVEQLGGPHVPAIGFGMGLERLLAVCEAEGVQLPLPKAPALFIGYIGDSAKACARKLVYALQNSGVNAVYDINARSLKAQLKYADKLGARYSLVLGDDELAGGSGELKNMSTGDKAVVSLDAEALRAALH